MLGSASPDAVPLRRFLALGCLVALLLRAHPEREQAVTASLQGRQTVESSPLS